MLHSQLFNYARLVAFEDGQLTVNLLDEAQPMLVEKLKKILKDRTGKPWLIKISSEEGQSTLAEVAAQKESQLLADVSEGPLVKYVLESFPGSKIEKITER